MIVNTDADGQYSAADIPRLVEPIVNRRADMVVGDRQVQTVEHFSPTKKLLQRLGSWVVRQASGTDVLDTTSGFRAYNREAALQLIVVSRYTYTLESLIQAGKMSVAIEDVPISPNPTERESRLLGSTSSYVRRNAFAIFRAYTLYEPLRVFMLLAHPLRRRSPLAAWSPVPARLDPQRRPQRPHPVADPGRGADAGRGPDVRPGDHRRCAGRPAGDRSSGSTSGSGGSSSRPASRPPTTSGDREPERPLTVETIETTVAR